MKFTKKETAAMPLEDRIREVRAAAEAYIDAAAEKLKLEAPGVPLGVLRQIIVARSSGCACRAALSAIQNDESGM